MNIRPSADQLVLMAATTPAWLVCFDQPFDRGVKAAKFPYSRYSPIETEADCLAVTQDETHKWDEALNLSLTAHLCKLIVLLNRSNQFQTTHTVIGSENPEKIKGYEWATTSIGVALTIIFRKPDTRFSVDDHVRLLRWLCQLISATHFAGDSTGWLLGVWPEVVCMKTREEGLTFAGTG